MSTRPAEYTAPDDQNPVWRRGYRAALAHMADTLRTDAHAVSAKAGFTNAVGAETAEHAETSAGLVRRLEDQLIRLGKDVAEVTHLKRILTTRHDQALADLALANAEIARLNTVIADLETK